MNNDDHNKFPSKLTPDQIARRDQESAVRAAYAKGYKTAMSRMADEKNPAIAMRERARKLRRALNIPEKPPADPRQSLTDHTRALDALFRQMLLDGGDSTLNEGAALIIALRTQNQFRICLQALDTAEKREEKSRRE